MTEHTVKKILRTIRLNGSKNYNKTKYLSLFVFFLSFSLSIMEYNVHYKMKRKQQHSLLVYRNTNQITSENRTSADISLPDTKRRPSLCVYGRGGSPVYVVVVVVNCKDPIVKVHLHGAVYSVVCTPQTYFQVITKAQWDKAWK